MNAPTQDDPTAQTAVNTTDADRWRGELVLELRLAEATGAQIGEVLAEVEVHCLDTGQSPAQAFGDPTEYAREVLAALPPRPGHRLFRLSTLVVAGVMTAGIALSLNGFDALLQGDQVRLTWPVLASIGVVIAAAVAAGALMPWLARGRFRAASAVAVLVAVVMVGTYVLSGLEVGGGLVVPAPASLVAGLLLVAATTLSLARTPGRDRVIDPRTGRDALPTSRALVLVAVLGVPVVLLGILLTLLLTSR